MRDFTLKVYRRYLEAIRGAYPEVLRFDELLERGELPARFCALRHDVDRRPKRALAMARLEHELGLRATYYFRTKRHTLRPDLIRAVAALGHEIGYHYESLSDTGEHQAALRDFADNLARLRALAPVRTISMHGRPLKPYDNRDLWRAPERRALLRERFECLGEIYLDIDYRDIAYLSDTGRSWSGGANLRDHVESEVSLGLRSSRDLLRYLQGQPHPRLVFQIHPERWADGLLPWGVQLATDTALNGIKRALQVGRTLRGGRRA